VCACVTASPAQQGGWGVWGLGKARQGKAQQGGWGLGAGGLRLRLLWFGLLWFGLQAPAQPHKGAVGCGAYNAKSPQQGGLLGAGLGCGG